MGESQMSKRRAGMDDDDDDDRAAKARLLAWQNPSSRICRVSRASGGKDRHSKVLTSKGLRDRRVRLSVSTAIQFYDLQDRLGYDQPSKAVDWLIKAASAAISELPSLDGAFADLSKQLVEVKSTSEVPGDEEVVGTRENGAVNQLRTKSACSSTSETSKGSVLSLSRSENHPRVRDKIEELKGQDDRPFAFSSSCHQQNHNSQSSFTDLLTSEHSPVAVTTSRIGLMSKQRPHVPPIVTTDYFKQGGLFGQPVKASPQSGFPVHAHFPTSSSTAMEILPFNLSTSTQVSGGDPEIQQQFPFLQDHLIPVAVATGGEYSLNFSISPGLAGLNRGTLQSNLQSPTSQLPHIQRFSSPADGTNLPFFFSAAAAPATSASAENPFVAGFDARLQLYYSDGYQQSDLKGKGKN